MIQFTSIDLQADGSWLFTWTPTSAAFYRVVLAGYLLDSVADPSYSFSLHGYPTYPPPLEVTEENTPALSETHANKLLVQWYAESCDYYTVAEVISGVPVPILDFVELGLEPVYSYTTADLVDGSSHSYQLTATGAGGVSTTDVFAINTVTPPAFIDGSRSVGYNKGTLSLVIN